MSRRTNLRRRIEVKEAMIKKSLRASVENILG